MSDDMEHRHDDPLFERARQLATDIAPSRDLWPGIAAAIGETKPQRSEWRTGWARAAAVVLLIGASSGLTYLALDRDANSVTPVGPGPALVFEPVSGSFGSQYNLGPDYADARRGLAGSLDEKLAALPEESRQAVVTNLATIRQAINELNRALASEPDNALLQELLIDTYREELAVMMKVDDATRAAMRRGDI